jgi:hypothetical protein
MYASRSAGVRLVSAAEKIASTGDSGAVMISFPKTHPALRLNARNTPRAHHGSARFLQVSGAGRFSSSAPSGLVQAYAE